MKLVQPELMFVHSSIPLSIHSSLGSASQLTIRLADAASEYLKRASDNQSLHSTLVCRVTRTAAIDVFLPAK